MPTGEQTKLIAALEDQAALINQLLGLLREIKAQAPTKAARAKVQAEIDYKIRELARVHRERDAIARQLGATQAKKR